MIHTLLFYWFFHALHLSLYSTLSVFKHCFYIRAGEIHIDNDLLLVHINRTAQLKVTYNITLKRRGYVATPLWKCSGTLKKIFV